MCDLYKKAYIAFWYFATCSNEHEMNSQILLIFIFSLIVENEASGYGNAEHLFDEII
jgi:hypothetical protein